MSSNTSSSSSNIKGGGRAIMSSQAEEELVSLLYDVRSHDNPLLPTAATSSSSSNTSAKQSYRDLGLHDKKKKRKKFLMKLLKCHQEYELSCRLNQQSSSSASASDSVSSSSCLKNKAAHIKRNSHDQTYSNTQDNDNSAIHSTRTIHSSSSSTINSDNRKVRIEVVEAIYKKDSTKISSSSNSSDKKKDKSKKKKANDNVDSAADGDHPKVEKNASNKAKSKKSSLDSSSTGMWKEGSIRKVMVLASTTLVQDLMSTCKSKLQMKKKPCRVFVVDRETGIEMDLLYDLSGLDNDHVVYVSSSMVHPIETCNNRGKEKDDDNDQGKEDKCRPEEEEKEEEENGPSSSLVLDPLEDIKKVYRMRKRGRGGGGGSSISRNRQEKKAVGDNNILLEMNNERLPPFAESLDKLEELSSDRSILPVAKYRHDVLLSLDSSRVIVIQGATGCGKSTQVPQFILEGMKAINCADQTNIIVTQPRRVAAISLAKRVAEERNMPLPGKKGCEIGYNVRLSKAVCKDTKVVYCTVGVLLRMMVNPMEYDQDDDLDDDNSDDNVDSLLRVQGNQIPLSAVTHVILDEVHERDLTTDFALTLLRPILSINQKISIILMSATASASMFVKYFQDNQLGIVPKILNIPGRTFPVQVQWLKDCEKLVSRQMHGCLFESAGNKEISADDGDNDHMKLSPFAREQIDYDFMTRIIKLLAQQQWTEDLLKDKNVDKATGSILVFLPGKGEIEALAKELYKDSLLRNTSKCLILKLHSSLSPSEQWRAFKPVKNGVVKIVLSTNVAETSITIPDVTVVIDSGRVKEMRFNSSTRINELTTVWVSQASSKQREGRAGRTSSGVCYKLYSEEFCQQQMLKQTCPEIMRTPLEDLVLQVCLFEEQRTSLGASPVSFLSKAPEAPPMRNLQEACSHLVEIGAINLIQNKALPLFRLTPLGYHLSHLPMDAKVGKILVIGCILQCLEPSLTIAAILSSSKSLWLPYLPGIPNSRREAQNVQMKLVSSGFGGSSWHGGTVHGDLIAAVAAYDAWVSSDDKVDKTRRRFASKYALDYNALIEIRDLRRQFQDYLRVAGLLRGNEIDNIHGHDAMLTSCCLVAGLYPNISTLLRPSRERRIRYGKLITKDGDSCVPNSTSFQGERVRNVGESGKDAYAVYHGKHLTLGVNSDSRIKQDPFLSDVNFVPRFAILLFGGQVEVRKNCLVVDNWLKFKIQDAEESKSELPDKCHINAIMVNELKKELDQMLVKTLLNDRSNLNTGVVLEECERVIQVVRLLLST